LDRCDFPGKRWLALLVPLPLMVPPFVGAIGIKQMLGQSGALNALLIHLGILDATAPIDWLREGRFGAVVALTALHLFPIVTFNVSAALASVNVELEEAAASLGCRGFRRFRMITLPAILPSVFAATSIVLIWGLTELGVPLVCDYPRVTSVQIFSGLKDIGRNPFVYAQVVVLLVTTVALYVATRALIGRSRAAAATKGSRRRQPQRLTGAKGLVATAGLAVVVGTAALPNVAVVLLAFGRDWYGTVLPAGLTFDHFRAAVGHDMVIPSIGNSLRYVTLSTGLNLILGTAIAWLVVRTRSRWAGLIDACAMLPLAVPGLVMAFGYLAISRDGRPLAFLNPTRDPTVLLVIAYAIRRLPFVVRSAAAGLAQISVTLEEAAFSLGAGPLRTFVRITLPLLAPHLLAGGVFAFALSMLEVSDSLILAQRQATFPITKAIYELLQLLGDGRQVAAALGFWAMLFLITAVSFARSVIGRGLRNIFRL
ncbi:MAG: iron ABC transporter permease, partial [Deltaproteobacteria bacterium]|nr:iron ABC transporter permease [Deltaproteobacteria bacterium]